MSILEKLRRERAEESMRTELERLQRLKANKDVQMFRAPGAWTGSHHGLLQQEVLVSWLQMLGELRHGRSFDARSKELLELQLKRSNALARALTMLVWSQGSLLMKEAFRVVPGTGSIFEGTSDTEGAR